MYPGFASTQGNPMLCVPFGYCTWYREIQNAMLIHASKNHPSDYIGYED